MGRVREMTVDARGESARRMNQLGNMGGLAIGLIAAATVLIADLVIGNRVVPITAVVIGPLLAAVLATPRVVSAVGLAAIVSAVALGAIDGLGVSTEFFVRVGVVSLGSIAAVALSSARVRQLARIVAEEESHDADLRMMFSGSAVGMMVVGIDGMVDDVNDAMCELLGVGRSEMVGHEVGARVHPDDRRPQDRAELLSGLAKSWSGDLRLRHRDGGWRWVRLTASVLHGPGGVPSGVLIQATDITQDKQAEADLESLLSSIREGVVVYDTTALVRASNKAARDICGASEDDLKPGLPLAGWIADRLVDTEGNPIANADLAVNRALDDRGIDGVVRGYDHPDGGRLWLSISTSEIELRGQRHIAVSLIDITERYEHERSLQSEAFHDPLTGLPNRRVLTDRLAVATSARKGGLAVMFIDLDGFKEVNDSSGHDVGDQLLQYVAGRLRSAVRPGDTVCRYAGDEFVLVCPDCSSRKAAELIAGRVLDSIAEPTITRVGPLRATASAGVAFVELPTDLEPADLLRRADHALYAAKGAGKSRFVLEAAV